MTQNPKAEEAPMTPQAGIAETPAGAGEDHILPCPACSSQLALPAAALVIHPLLRLLLCAKDRTGYFSSQYGPQLKADNNPAFEKMLAGLSLPCTEGSCSSPPGTFTDIWIHPGLSSLTVGSCAVYCIW